MANGNYYVQLLVRHEKWDLLGACHVAACDDFYQIMFIIYIFSRVDDRYL